MPIEKTKKIWMDGELVDWDDAKVHVLTHTLHYGTGVFEGIRGYKTKNGTSVFRLDRPHAPAAPLREGHHDGPPVLGRAARRGDERDDPRRTTSRSSRSCTSVRSCTSATASSDSTR